MDSPRADIDTYSPVPCLRSMELLDRNPVSRSDFRRLQFRHRRMRRRMQEHCAHTHQYISLQASTEGAHQKERES